MKNKNNTPQEIWDKLKCCKKVAMSLHGAPDGDSLGSCTALKYVLERDLKIQVDLVSRDELDEALSKMTYAKEVDFEKDLSDLDLKTYDAIIALDMGNIKRIPTKLKENFSLPVNSFLVNIDHHPSNNNYGDLNYIFEDSPSACSILLNLFKSLNVKFDAELSNRLLLGICTDSGFFSIDNHPEKALQDANFLIEHGANYLENILRPIKYQKPLKQARYLAILINNLKIIETEKFGYSTVSLNDVKKLNLNASEIRQGIGELANINGLDFIFALTETEKYIKGSFRSRRSVDVSLFAQELGGGGHKAAAGFALNNISLDQATKKVLDTIERVGIHKIN